ncbi:hypothetical protein CMI37_13320 [Candidatus Pacearchaeota archaeon]|nr:hypothetical protein [Candidatus Pacearchaeota archaeon]|tara:strand:- start:4263 stop:4481 length:219 start_codon:yes stop_codon:yes gene_type:complete
MICRFNLGKEKCFKRTLSQIPREGETVCLIEDQKRMTFKISKIQWNVYSPWEYEDTPIDVEIELRTIFNIDH